MNDNGMMATANNLIYLVSCAVNNELPNSEICEKMDSDAVFRMALDHQLSALAAYALQKSGHIDDRWNEAFARTIRKQLLFDNERTKILKALDRSGIWYLPLKGVVLKDYYPQPMLREMSDNDILCDRTKAEEIRTIMEECGYSTVKYGQTNHDEYQKPPLLFEMHTALFSPREMPLYAEYYKEPELKLIPDGISRFGRRMTDEDFYIYILCHMHKHYSTSGTGLRSLLDVFVFLKRKEGALNRAYIDTELEHLGIIGYEKQVRELSQKLFSHAELTDSERIELDFYVNSKCHGTLNNKVANMLGRNGSDASKRNYMFRRVFPTHAYVKKFYPTVSRYRILYPFLVVYRPVKGLVKHPKKLVAEYRILKNYEGDNDHQDGTKE